jgi:hypothetical protein
MHCMLPWRFTAPLHIVTFDVRMCGLPDLTLNVGDTINGTITLSTPLTVPAGTNGNGVVVALLLDGSGTS